MAFLILRYQYAPNVHHSLAPRHGRTFDANPSKVSNFNAQFLKVWRFTDEVRFP